MFHSVSPYTRYLKNIINIHKWICDAKNFAVLDYERRANSQEYTRDFFPCYWILNKLREITWKHLKNNFNRHREVVQIKDKKQTSRFCMLHFAKRQVWNSGQHLWMEIIRFKTQISSKARDQLKYRNVLTLQREYTRQNASSVWWLRAALQIQGIKTACDRNEFAQQMASEITWHLMSSSSLYISLREDNTEAQRM